MESQALVGLTDEERAALEQIAAERGITPTVALHEAVMYYARTVSRAARLAAGLDWVLEEHHAVLVKLGE